MAYANTADRDQTPPYDRNHSILVVPLVHSILLTFTQEKITQVHSLKVSILRGQWLYHIYKQWKVKYCIQPNCSTVRLDFELTWAMLRMSYSDHFLSIICSSVHLCICLLTFSNDFSSEAQASLAQISYGDLGEQKIAKKVMVRWPRYLPCPYTLCMIKTCKNLLPQIRGCLGAESLHKSLWTGDLPKLLNWW